MERRDVVDTTPMSPTSFVIDTSLDIDTEHSRNFNGLAMKF
jgi:hypothetical protein